jgi:uncharacterized protein (DUF736 family)
MIIGTFKTNGSAFAGTIRTLSLDRDVVFEPITGKSDKSPDYRVTAAGHGDLGIAWKEISQAGNPYLAVRLDDPSFAAPIYCRLVETGDHYALMWNRDLRRNRDADE